ncbi:hypothetical protein CLOM_g14494, partial [Closterium sp. NIES-68]
VIKSYIL